MVPIKIGNREAISELKSDGNCKDTFRCLNVLKWSYPKDCRIPEIEIMEMAHKVLERYDSNPILSGKMTTVKISETLPRVLFKYNVDEEQKKLHAFLRAGPEEKRILRLTIFEYLQPIHSLGNLVQFKESIRHIVLGIIFLSVHLSTRDDNAKLTAIHYLATSEESIKHRDINVNNLMFRRLGDDQIQGVLCDWDQASTYETEKLNDPTRLRYGTRAFMALDILESSQPPVHLERFDFESLFYVMCWISINYSEGRSIPECDRHPSAKEWSSWNAEDDWMVVNKKYALLREFYLTDTELYPPFFQPLVFHWLFPLKRLFHEGYNKLGYHRESVSWHLYLESSTDIARSYIAANVIPKPTEFDYSSLGGLVTFEKIWEILSRPDL